MGLKMLPRKAVLLAPSGNGNKMTQMAHRVMLTSTYVFLPFPVPERLLVMSATEVDDSHAATSQCFALLPFSIQLMPVQLFSLLVMLYPC